MLKTFPTICASVAANPSPLGVRLHNAGYEAKKLDFTYVAMGSESIEEAISAFKLLNYRGMGVSMPFKQSVINLLDAVDESVKVIGACNTVVNNDGKLTGYNTDWVGAQNAIAEVIDIHSLKKAVIIGAGGVARAIAYALKINGLAVYICARNDVQRKTLVDELELAGESAIEDQDKFGADIIVNATPIATDDSPLKLELHPTAKVVFDVVFQTRMTALTQKAVSLGKIIVSGWRMLLLQGAKQFELYTQEEAPIEAMGEVLEKWLPA